MSSVLCLPVQCFDPACVFWIFLPCLCWTFLRSLIPGQRPHACLTGLRPKPSPLDLLAPFLPFGSSPGERTSPLSRPPLSPLVKASLLCSHSPHCDITWSLSVEPLDATFGMDIKPQEQHRGFLPSPSF
ncbi:hypothetical protein XENOCAPTIV_007138 [Xenoophorus captivus]|uniref:Uncharacterized protein n=1 Tax=Xenoophorus captivus TaxID=1517983 RepID=A0ABV0QCU6_9TELE